MPPSDCGHRVRLQGGITMTDRYNPRFPDSNAYRLVLPPSTEWIQTSNRLREAPENASMCVGKCVPVRAISMPFSGKHPSCIPSGGFPRAWGYPMGSLYPFTCSTSGLYRRHSALLGLTWAYVPMTARTLSFHPRNFPFFRLFVLETHPWHCTRSTGLKPNPAHQPPMIPM